MQALMNRTEYRREYVKKHPELAQYHREKSLVRGRAVRHSLLEFLGLKCVNCGFDDERALEIDHIIAGGFEDQKIHGKGLPMYIYYLENPKIAILKLQVLCANCNSIKRVENREVRH